LGIIAKEVSQRRGKREERRGKREEGREDEPHEQCYIRILKKGD
jgi:hypothetical protein